MGERLRCQCSFMKVTGSTVLSVVNTEKTSHLLPIGPVDVLIEHANPCTNTAVLAQLGVGRIMLRVQLS